MPQHRPEREGSSWRLRVGTEKHEEEEKTDKCSRRALRQAGAAADGLQGHWPHCPLTSLIRVVQELKCILLNASHK